MLGGTKGSGVAVQQELQGERAACMCRQVNWAGWFRARASWSGGSAWKVSGVRALCLQHLLGPFQTGRSSPGFVSSTNTLCHTSWWVCTSILCTPS